MSGDNDAEIDDEVGVAVVLDEEGQESNEDKGFQIRDDDEGGEGDKDAEAEDALVMDGASSSKAGGNAKADKISFPVIL